jgi:alkaline phosphatase D
VAARRLDRRAFLTRATAFAAVAVPVVRYAGDAARAARSLPRVDDEPADVRRVWLGAPYWANRLQDWRLRDGRMECVAEPGETGGRTVAVLTHELVAGGGSASFAVRTGVLAEGTGFSGFLLGAGGGALDHRAAALVGRASGVGGGLFCTYEADGRIRFREHTNEARPFEYAPLSAAAAAGPAPPRATGEDVVLRLDVEPQPDGRFTLTLTARDHADGTLRATASRRDVPEADTLGGIALVSSSLWGSGARFWFRALRAGGAKLAVHPERALGPIVGTLYTVAGGTLKLTAQLVPIGRDEPQRVRLDHRLPGGSWTPGPVTTVGPGYTALFRIPRWDATRLREYRVVYAPGTPRRATYTGVVQADPGTSRPLAIGMVNCTIHSFRPLDHMSSGEPRLPGERRLGLYTPENLYFPYRTVAEGIAARGADLLVALGDQLYETRPTHEDPGRAPILDFLYRYYLWLWSFRSLTRDRPTVVLVDDHDVGQGNLWGHEGAAAPGGDPDEGGYARAASFVNAVQRIQCAHNPDPVDPTAVQQGIAPLYTAFRYGGTSFAVLEDRKWKGGGPGVAGPYASAPLELLGARQERFLADWAAASPDAPRVCLTGTLLGSLQTGPDGQPVADHDSNGYPAEARARAVRALGAAGTLVLSGDQHLASLVRHGVDGFHDGPLQFVAPAAGSAFQRWFEPGPLANAEATPHTGDFTDAFGNRMHVHAVANPPLTFAAYRAGHPTGQELGDRAQKSDGYGIVRVDHAGAAYEIECWPWDAGPDDAQYPGWPFRLPFADA